MPLDRLNNTCKFELSLTASYIHLNIYTYNALGFVFAKLFLNWLLVPEKINFLWNVSSKLDIAIKLQKKTKSKSEHNLICLGTNKKVLYCTWLLIVGVKVSQIAMFRACLSETRKQKVCWPPWGGYSLPWVKPFICSRKQSSSPFEGNRYYGPGRGIRVESLHSS